MFCERAEDVVISCRECCRNNDVCQPATAREQGEGCAGRGARRALQVLVKGAYWEEERIVAAQNDWPVPVYEDKAATDASYERCTDALLAAWPHLRPAFGTHNPRSIAQAAVKARRRAAQGRYRVSDAVRDGRRAARRRGEAGLPDARLRAGRRRRAGHGVPRAAAAGEHVQPVVVHQGRAHRSRTTSCWRHRSSANAPAVEHTDAFTNMATITLHEPSVRETAREALLAVRAALHSFGKTSRCISAGSVRCATGPWTRCAYPADPSLSAGPRGAGDACRRRRGGAGRPRAAFPAWRDRPVERARAAILRRAADLMEQRRYELAALMVYESAKPWREADGDVIEACDYLRYYAARRSVCWQPVPMAACSGEDNVYVREGRGVAAVIAPWNFPLAIITRHEQRRAGRRQLRHPQARRAVAADRRAARRNPARGRRAGGRGAVPARARRRGRRRRWSSIPACRRLPSRAARPSGSASCGPRPRCSPGQRRSSASWPRWAARTRSSSMTTPTSTRRSRAPSSRRLATPGRNAAPAAASSSSVSAYDEALSRLAPAVESLVVGPPHEPATYVPPVISDQARKQIEAYIEAANGRRATGAGQGATGRGLLTSRPPYSST